jgi:hypothetical protein
MAESEKARVWADRLAVFESSGLSRREWCRQQGLNPNTLDYWRSRLRTSVPAPMPLARDTAVGSTVPELVPIVVTTVHREEAVAPKTSGVSIDLPSGMRVRADALIDVTWLAALVRGIAGC